MNTPRRLVSGMLVLGEEALLGRACKARMDTVSLDRWRLNSMKFIRTLFLSLLALTVVASLGISKAEYAKKESKPCTFCHPAGKFKELTDAGKYYKEHNHSLEGYQASEEKK
jgi:hypothetical protein